MEEIEVVSTTEDILKLKAMLDEERERNFETEKEKTYKRMKAMSKKRGLTLKQLKFIEAYTKTYNLTQSAIAAGYSAHSAGTVAHSLFKNPLIKERIDMIKQEEINRLRNRR